MVLPASNRSLPNLPCTPPLIPPPTRLRRDSIWLVALTFANHRNVANLELFFLTCRMFWNTLLFARLVFGLDWTEGPDVEKLSVWLKRQYPYPYVVDVAPIVSADAVRAFRSGMHDRRGIGYDKQQFLKLYTDRIAERAAKENKVDPPTIVGLLDDDVYWQTLATRQTVFDSHGRLIVHAAPVDRVISSGRLKSFFTTTERVLGIQQCKANFTGVSNVWSFINVERDAVAHATCT
eukprot:TRINITY_DN7321_c0_g1_i1.p1 TRINITY_DN7321_c0_g1~~TRINITY_DN7321_c0_g1_i1.p1  ORF type:complete len:235 (-),score=27.91 TRINITY_DN7321_c0_g1_i1:122-826(-)